MSTSTNHNRRVLTALGAAHVAMFAFALLVIHFISSADGDWPLVGVTGIGISVGLLVGQFLSLCAWTAFGTGRYVVRFLLAIAIIMSFAYGSWLMGRVWNLRGWESGASYEFRISVFYVLLFTFVQIPYWTIRRIKGWRIEPRSKPCEMLHAVGARFNVLDMLAWTAYLAVPLALLKFMPNEMSAGELFLVMLVYVALLIVPIAQSMILIWSGLGPGRANWKRHSLIVFALAMGLTILGTLLMVEAWDAVMRTESVRGVIQKLIANWEQSLIYGFISLGMLLPLLFSVRFLFNRGYELRTATQSGMQRGTAEMA